MSAANTRPVADIAGTGYCFESGSMTGILEKPKWESLKKRRRDSRLILLYKGLKGAASIPTYDLITSPPTLLPPHPHPHPHPPSPHPKLGAVEIITH